MKSSQVLISALTIVAFASQMACSAKIEGVASDSLAGGGSGQSSEGFDLNTLNGEWKTGCITDHTGYKIENTLTLNGGQFKSVVKIYHSNTCRAADLITTHSQEGRFVAAGESSTEPGSQNIDIEIPQGPNVTEIQYELARLENGQLYLGNDFAEKNGNYPSKVDKQRPFTK